MKKRIIRIDFTRALSKGKSVILVTCCLFLFTTCASKRSDKLTIAAAANTQFVMEALVESFTKSSGIECETIIGSSGKLTAQIKGGAPFNIFISADMKYPALLFEDNYTLEAPKIYAHGQLVLWTMIEGIQPSLDLLSAEDIGHIALANPKTAPYGLAAMEVLNHYGLSESLVSKLVYGESISQTNQFINSGAAEIGFTAKSVVLSPQMLGKGHWVEIARDAYTPIAQGVVILKQDEDQLEQAQKFYDFLFSDKGKEILDKFGYLVTE